MPRRNTLVSSFSRTFLALVCWFGWGVFFAPAFAAPNYFIRSWQSEQGLPQNKVMAVVSIGFVSWKAGVTGTLKIAHLAEAHGLRCEVHCPTMGFMDLASRHVSCAIKNCEYFELLGPEEPFRFPMKDKYPIDKNGIAHVPQKPGIGVELDWDAIDRAWVEHKITKVS